MTMIRGMKWCLVQGAWCGDKERRLSQAAGTDGAAGSVLDLDGRLDVQLPLRLADEQPVPTAIPPSGAPVVPTGGPVRPRRLGQAALLIPTPSTKHHFIPLIIVMSVFPFGFPLREPQGTQRDAKALRLCDSLCSLWFPSENVVDGGCRVGTSPTSRPPMYPCAAE